jgi:DNA invertase Pin-like site-specific DNA recombinase
MARARKIRTEGAVAYLRVSTEEQAVSGLGMAAQEAAVRAECVRRGLPLLALYADPGVSAKNLDRPGLREALAVLDAGEASVLVVAKLDRLTRSVHDATGLMLAAERAGWGLVALDVAVDTTTPQGAAMAQVLAVFAELERRLIGERTRVALAALRAQGMTLGRPRTMTNDVRQRIVSAHTSGSSFSQIARELTAEGVPTSQGGAKWYPSTVRAVVLSAEVAA